MKYLLCFTLLCFYGEISNAQFKVTFVLGNSPITHTADKIFIASSFNNWNPANLDQRFINAGKTNELVVYLPAGDYQYKFTRGSWVKVEAGENGVDIGNRLLELESDTTITIDILSWKDDYPPAAKKHTASKQVHIMDTAFLIPQLDRSRKIWVYLPEGYSKSKKRYPVLYMHDGQNIFDAATSGFGEWGVDECLDSLTRTSKFACIVIGIENGPRRLTEYNPFEFEKFGPGEGDLYIDFLVQTLKPFVDKKYRTLAGKENTMIAGSSMGGLISYYAMLREPSVFGKAGVFSPAFWTAPGIVNFTDSLASRVSGKFLFYVGAKEGDAFVKDMQNVQELLGEKSSAMIYSIIDPQGLHNEKAWRKWLPEFFSWMLAEGYNTVIKVEN